MLKGKVISIAKDKGFGFIAPAKGGDDLFFHHLSIGPDFGLLEVGEEIQYEVDTAAAKPRAKSVLRLGSGGAGSAARRETAARRRPEHHGPSFLHAELGFVTKLRKRERLGFISADSGGPELLFGKEHVSGMKPFSALVVGDSVRFIREVDPQQVGPPLASAVQFIERRQKKAGPELPPNPSARRKKPTWRR